MSSLMKLGSAEGVFLLGGFLCVVLWKLFTGEISLSYLLDGDERDAENSDGSGFSSSPSAGRTQMLIVTVFVASWYLLQVIHNPREFPKPPDAMVAALGGSQALYLGGKLQSMFFAGRDNSSK